MPAGLTFSSASVTLLLQTGHPERYPFRTCHRFSMSWRLEKPFCTRLHKDAESETDGSVLLIMMQLPGKNRSGSRSPFLSCTLASMDQEKCSDAAPSPDLTPYLHFETNPSGLSCPLSRYRPGLQIFYSVNKKIRPVDRQRLLSAYPAGYPA